MHRLAIHQGRQLGQQSLAAIQIRIHGTQLRLQARGLEEHQRYLHHRGHGTACIVQRILRFPQPLGERIRVARLALGVVQQDVRGQVPGVVGGMLAAAFAAAATAAAAGGGDGFQ